MVQSNVLLVVVLIMNNICFASCDAECLLDENHFIFDYRGITFEDAPDVFICQNINMLPSTNMYTEDGNLALR